MMLRAYIELSNERWMSLVDYFILAFVEHARLFLLARGNFFGQCTQDECYANVYAACCALSLSGSIIHIMHFEILSDNPMKYQSYFEASQPINIYHALSVGFPTNV
jgi:hypothetical protein